MSASIDDLEAIDSYMKKQVPQTATATQMQHDFLQWYVNLGNWDLYVNTDDTYDKARSKRNSYNIANAVTPAEKQQVTNVLTTGLTTEQMQGQSRPPVNTSTGEVGKKDTMNIVSGNGKSLTRVLTFGTYGDDVATWQTRMGISPPTKYFGQTTKDKTKAFQKANGLDDDGAVGEHTWLAAFPVAKASVPAPKPAPVTTTFAPAKPADKPVTFAPKPTVAKPIAVPVVKPPITVAKPPVTVSSTKPPITTAPKSTIFAQPKTTTAKTSTPPKTISSGPTRIDVPKKKTALASMLGDPIVLGVAGVVTAGVALAVMPKKPEKKEGTHHVR